MDDPEAVLDRAFEAGVTPIVCVGTDLNTSEAAFELARTHDDVAPTVGLHPHDASRLEAERPALEALANRSSVVGIGETGFDFHYLHSPPDAQEAAFRWQIQLAKHLDLALVVHSRAAWDATFRVLDDEGAPARTVFHCFTGGPDEAHRALAFDAYLSYSGIATFPDASDVRHAIATTPIERVLVETDAPYLAPVPVRGRVNEPAFVQHVGAVVASALDRDAREVAERVRANTKVVFGS